MTATDITGTAVDTLQPAGGIGQYQAGLVMTPDAAKALDEQVRACTRAVLREGVDYGHIPGTNGEEKSLWRPGAQKLLQWFGLGCTCERVEVERDDEGRKHGITYRAVVARRLPDGTREILATCEGTADYDESKFYQTAEQVQRKAEDRERAWAEKDKRPARPTKWQGLPEYRADWNALMKRAQKRAIVGAVVDATAAGGIFSDREEDDIPAPDGGPAWYEETLEAALTFTTQKAGRQLYTDAAQAARDGLCTPRQANHIQNRIEQRARLLKTSRPADVGDLGRETAAAGDSTRSQRGQDQAPRPADEHATHPAPAAAGGVAAREPQRLPPPADEDEPGDPAERHDRAVGIVQGHLKRLGYAVNDDDREERVVLVARLARVAYDPDTYTSVSDFEEDELALAAGALSRQRDRDALDKLLKTGEVDD